MPDDDDDSYNWEEDALGSWRDAIAEIKRQVESGEELHPAHEELFKPRRE